MQWTALIQLHLQPALRAPNWQYTADSSQLVKSAPIKEAGPANPTEPVFPKCTGAGNLWHGSQSLFLLVD